MKKRFSILIMCSLIVLFSCSEDKPTEPENNAPIIQSVTASPDSLITSRITLLTCVATDSDGDIFACTWTADEGTFPQGNSGSSVYWNAPNKDGEYKVSVIVSDVKKNS